ncbi:proteasome subunit alpha type-7-like [Plodia interpunctella]|uniref:proteasome subunit alpha type-7-like n=1 Tax=Plodia interpunctella TaxID=58824 RepID=UPI003101714E
MLHATSNHNRTHILVENYIILKPFRLDKKRLCGVTALNETASSIGRCDKSVREFLEEKYTPALVATENGAVKLAIKALLEVIQSGQKNLQVAVITNGKPMKLLDEDLVASISAEIAHEKAKAESDKKKK